MARTYKFKYRGTTYNVRRFNDGRIMVKLTSKGRDQPGVTFFKTKKDIKEHYKAFNTREGNKILSKV